VKNNRKLSNEKKIILFTAAALIAAVLGTWLLLEPQRERDYVAAQQEAMMDEITSYIYEAEQAATDAADITDLLYIEDEEETTSTDSEYFYEPYGDNEYNGTAYEPENPVIASFDPVFSDPIPDNSFPNAIVGIGILTIDSINLRLPIADDIEYATLRIAPGRVPQTVQIGDIGNAVIAGHRNYAFGSMFNRLGEIEIGDIMQYQARSGELMEFEVFEIAVIEPENQIAFLQPTTESIITLYTCTPIRAATHRLIIRAERVS